MPETCTDAGTTPKEDVVVGAALSGARESGTNPEGDAASSPVGTGLGACGEAEGTTLCGDGTSEPDPMAGVCRVSCDTHGEAGGGDPATGYSRRACNI
jgi:hypothetical protein